MAQVLIVQHSTDDPSGLVGAQLVAAGHSTAVVRCHLGEEQPRSLDGYAGLVVLGGDMGAYDDADYPWLTGTKRLLREAVHRDLPTLAICLGHQLLAVAAGGAVAVAPSPQLGLVPVELTATGEADRLFGSLGESPTAIHWNSDLVVTPPDGSVLLSTSTAGVQALRLGSRVYGVQFHPEIDLDTVSDWADADVAAGRLAPDLVRARLAEVDAISIALERRWTAFARRFTELLPSNAQSRVTR